MTTFRGLLSKVIMDIHKVEKGFPKPEKFAKLKDDLIKEANTDCLQVVKLEYLRNLRQYPFIRFCDSKTLHQIHTEILTKLNQFNKSKTLQDYESYLLHYDEDTEKYLDTIDAFNLEIQFDEYKETMLYVMTSGHTSIIVMINNESHMKIIGAQRHKIDLCELYEKTNYIHDILCDLFDFDYDNEFGYVNSDIKLVGRGGKMVGYLKLINIPSDVTSVLNLKHTTTPHVYIWSMIQSLGMTEENFFKEIVNQLFNVNYIETNPNDAAIEDLSNNNIFSRGTKLYESISDAYVASYNEEKYKHFIPDNYTLNRLIVDLLAGKSNVNLFTQFPSFFKNFLLKFKNVSDEVTQGLTYLIAKNQITNIRDSPTRLRTCQLIDVKSLKMKIRRNIHGFDFNQNLSSEKRGELLKLVESSLTGYDKLNLTIRTDESDHITFDFNYQEGELVESILNFFNSYKEVTASLENKGVIYLHDAHLGFITHDLEYLGTGFAYTIDIVNHTDKELSLTPSQEKEGFTLENSKGLLTLNSNLNINVSADRVFEVTEQMFEAIKIPPHSHPQEVITVASEINNPTETKQEEEPVKEDDGPEIEDAEPSEAVL